MSKPIMLTPELIEQMTQEFKEKLSKIRLSDGKIDYTRSFKYKSDDHAGVKVLIEPLAYLKMMSLVDTFTTEVGWHGVVRRDADDTFIITDILVYPQVVTGATVNTDDESYAKWLMTIDNDTFNAMHMHGHSHVNFAPTPSGVDDTHREKLLAQIGQEDFYIFMIWNKSGQHTACVYDLKTNTLYEDEDVEVSLTTEGFDMEAFLKNANEMVKSKYSAGGTSAATVYAGSAGKGGKKKSIGRAKQETVRDSYSGYGGYGGYAGSGVTDYDDLIFGSGRGY